MSYAVTQYAESGEEFYPTPAPLVEKLLEGIEWHCVHTILEPSAGKGDILKRIAEKEYTHAFDVDVCEIDPNLRAVLKNTFGTMRLSHNKKAPETGYFMQGISIVYDDFLKYDPFKTYDLIVMNPPFSNGDAHLLKALEIQKNGGAIACILNAETIRNPYTERRKHLCKLLKEYDASIEYVENGFSTAERRTDVAVALIKVVIPQVEETSEFYERMKAAESVGEDFNDTSTELDVTDFIKSMVAHFNVEVKTGIKIIREYSAFARTISQTQNGGCILALTDETSGQRWGVKATSINSYLKKVRLKYWTVLLSNPKFTGKLTSKLQEEYRKKVDKLAAFDFNEYNIEVLSVEMMAQVKGGIEDEIIAMFDRLTAEHTWYDKTCQNRHYYDGWATNKAWKIDKKVIIPCYTDSGSSASYRAYKAVDVLSDIEKILNFFDGHMTADVDMSKVIEKHFEQGITSKIPCKFFKATFYKKGTVHLEFTCPELVERFNIYAAQNRGWLPPSYGKKKYKDMTPAEKAVVDTFQGERKYEEVLRNAGYYLTSPVQNNTMLLLEGGA